MTSMTVSLENPTAASFEALPDCTFFFSVVQVLQVCVCLEGLYLLANLGDGINVYSGLSLIVRGSVGGDLLLLSYKSY